MPLAPVINLGLALKSRFAVNGIQYSSSEFGSSEIVVIGLFHPVHWTIWSLVGA
jgi:hypothetical protein